jgi:hypothetical protein
VTLRLLMTLAGVGQLALALASLAVPRVLGWKEETARLEPLTRQVFWTYAGYVLCAHVAFGLLSALAPESLLDSSTLAACVTAFIATWWGVRLVLQLAAFDRSARPSGALFVLLERLLVGAFGFFTGVYGYAAWRNLAT